MHACPVYGLEKNPVIEVRVHDGVARMLAGSSCTCSVRAHESRMEASLRGLERIAYVHQVQAAGSGDVVVQHVVVGQPERAVCVAAVPAGCHHT